MGVDVQPGQRLLHYRLVEQLGAGGMGVVWRAEDTVLGRSVAIKILPEQFGRDPERLARFEREARFLASLNHANIAAIYGLHESEGIRFLCMELVSGMDLARRLASGPLSLVEALDVGLQVTRALEATHAAGVIHRDLKPANITLTPDGQVKVLDFGLAKSVMEPPAPDESSAPTITSGGTRFGTILGTPAYMSPEQARGQSVDARGDMWAFGCVLYETLCGRRAFAGETVSDTIAAVLKEDPDWSALPSETPAVVLELLRRCLTRDSAGRPGSMKEIREALESVRRDPSGSLPISGLGSGVFPASGTTAGGKSIAVLPFVNMSSDPEQDYFCDGIAEELMNGFGRIQELRVASRTSAFQFRGAGLDVREVGARLNVATILEGSVRRVGQRLRITVQLVNVADGYRIWSDRYDRTLDDIFAIQDEIAGAIVEQLRVTLSPAERQALHQACPCDVRAYDFYLRGRQFFLRWERKSWDFAIQMFEQAIALDAGYARAYAGIAECCVNQFLYGGGQDVTERADAASKKALELDPGLSDAQRARGLTLFWLKGERTRADEHFERAIELDSRIYENFYLYARCQASSGNHARALELFQKAMALRPDDYQVPLLVPQLYHSLGRLEEARAARRRGVERVERHVDLNPDDIRALVLGSSCLVDIGQAEKGMSWGQRALQIAPDEPMVLYNVACTYSMAGRVDEALDYLDRAQVSGMRHRSWIENDSEFDAIRAHPRFAQILDRMDESGRGTPGTRCADGVQAPH